MASATCSSAEGWLEQTTTCSKCASTTTQPHSRARSPSSTQGQCASTTNVAQLEIVTMSYVKGRSDLRETVAGTARRTRLAAPGATRFTAMGWPIDARGLTEELIHLRNHMAIPTSM